MRPRPQPITGTPPPIDEKVDAKVIQQTCTLFGLDLVSLLLTRSLRNEITEFFFTTGTSTTGTEIPFLHRCWQLQARIPTNTSNENEFPRNT